MAFNIVMQRNGSEPIRVDKNLTTLSTISGELKDGTSIIDPVILVYGDVASFSTCNYCTIESFSRSYFIRDIKTIRTGIIEITCHVDVVSSFKTQLRANSAIIKRQQNSYNLYVDDGAFKVYQNPIVQTKVFSGGFTTQEYVLAVAGD